MNTTEQIKQYILHDCKMDAVGIAPVSAFDYENGLHTPEHILPNAKSVIVFTKRIPDGVIQAAFRRLEDHNADAHSIYAAFGSDLTPNMTIFLMQFNIAQYIERNFGFVTVPLPSGPSQNVTQKNEPMPAFIGPRRIRYLLHSERAAVAAGLGELGWNNLLLTPENGPRQGIGLVITTLELDYDPPYQGEKLCDPETCGICSAVCPMHAIPGADGAFESYKIAGLELKTAQINNNACAVCSMAFRKEFSVKGEVEDLIMKDDPSDEELSEQYLKRSFSDISLEHFPKHYCSRCLLYCPVGRWKERFADKGLSKGVSK